MSTLRGFLSLSPHTSTYTLPSLLFSQDIVLSRGLNMRSRDRCTMYTSLCFRGPLVRVFTGSGPVVVPCYLVLVYFTFMFLLTFVHVPPLSFILIIATDECSLMLYFCCASVHYKGRLSSFSKIYRYVT